MIELTDRDREMFKRQIDIPGFGEEAQRKLKNSSALITRVGGLGGPVSLLLAMAGVGKIVILHSGRLTWSNLNRQILMRHDHVGKPRIECATELFERLHPECKVVAAAEDANEENAKEWVSQVDVVCDCPPSFEERYALNKACVELRKPMIEAAMYGMEGTLTTIVPGETPCLACLVPEKPPWWETYGFPVLGAVSAALGCLAAVEAIKVLTGFGEMLKGKMLSYDANAMDFYKFPVERRADCPVCGSL
ncbi:MAG: HesA/MoeB/ThiF family protein [Armatimonadota bacterium]|nr:MAG: HesA/MoeB/ThiF family protein [Armatimonadota bacterium]